MAGLIVESSDLVKSAIHQNPVHAQKPRRTPHPVPIPRSRDKSGEVEILQMKRGAEGMNSDDEPAPVTGSGAKKTTVSGEVRPHAHSVGDGSLIHSRQSKFRGYFLDRDTR
mmetsp:Transcript_29908/g.88906  ORF Transcript_29908/g.88906 Transcript_29908/m.88906 type:complete len:111 (+) Transcript_29908:829-1161(+)